MSTLLALLLAAPPPATGGLRIESQPGVEVLWEGVSLGTTGADGVLTIADAPLGLFVVTLRQSGFQDATVEVEIRPGKKTLPIALVPTTVLAAPPPAAAAEPPVIATRTGPEARTAAPDDAEPRPSLPVEALPQPESGRPPPATIVAASGEPAPAASGPRSPPAAAATSSASPPGSAVNVLYLLALALLLGALSRLLLRRSRARLPLPPAGLAADPPSFDLPGEDDRAAGSGAPERRTAPFLEALKRREQALDERSRAPRPGADEIIDVEVTAVRTAEPS